MTRVGDSEAEAARATESTVETLATTEACSPLRKRAFVVGPENRLAVPALQRLLMGNDPSVARQLFNPLVLLGPTGTGKSHLTRGMTRHWQTELNESAVAYMTAIDFARQLRDARDNDGLDAYREERSGLQLLIIEDLQRLPTSLFIQRELRDTLDQQIEAGTAVVITAQQPPAAMAGLEAGLRDRLASGLTVRLQPPGVEARVELLRLAANDRGYPISNQTLKQLAQKVDGAAPQVMRTIAQHVLIADLSSHDRKQPADLSASNETAELNTLRAMKGATPVGPVTEDVIEKRGTAATGAPPPLELKQIIAVVARYYSFSQAALRSAARRKSLVHARGIAIYLARALTDVSYAQIGQVLGRRDHSTIIHAARSIERKLASDAGTQQDIEELQRILNAV